MPWIEELLRSCRAQREESVDQLERFETGEDRLFRAEEDISGEAASRLRRRVREMDRLIALAMTAYFSNEDLKAPRRHEGALANDP
jgi:hypothetical protein